MHLLTDIMGMRVLTGLMIILITGVMMAGCTQSSPGMDGSSQAGSPESGVMTDDGIDKYPPPPVDNAVSAQINDKDLTDRSISVFFSGGKGQKMVRDAWIVVKRSDGSIERVPLPPTAQSEVKLEGSDGEDLIRVFAEYYDGAVYQIGEKRVKMRMRA